MVFLNLSGYVCLYLCWIVAFVVLDLQNRLYYLELVTSENKILNWKYCFAAFVLQHHGRGYQTVGRDVGASWSLFCK
jgi:hypothetical protein